MILLLVLKLAVTIGVVVGLSLIAERVSPMVAGILAGYPLGSSIVLFFFGLEHGASFAAESAVYMTAGLVAELVFLFIYYKTSVYFDGKIKNIIASSLSAVLAFLLVIWSIQLFTINAPAAVTIYLAALLISIYLFRLIPNYRIEKKVKINIPTMLLRALLAAAMVLAITGSASLVGTTWAGLFGAFPTTLYPLILIIHWTHGKEYAHTFIKHVPNGLGSLLIYIVSVMLFYPQMGLYWGTLVSLGAATVYLMIYNRVAKKWLKLRPSE